MEHTIKLFIKFGSHKNIIDLYENGSVYINTVEHFRKLEDNGLRGDNYEGISSIINSLPGTFRIHGIDRDFNYIKAHIIETYDTILGNIFSLYAISSKGFPNPLDYRFHEKNIEFGTHCLIIKDLPEFFERMKKALRANKYNFEHGFIEYYDKETYNGPVTLFQKPLEYEYQQEFRFYVYNDSVKPIKLNIGSLKDISEIIPMEHMFHVEIIPNPEKQ